VQFILLYFLYVFCVWGFISGGYEPAFQPEGENEILNRYVPYCLLFINFCSNLHFKFSAQKCSFRNKYIISVLDKFVEYCKFRKFHSYRLPIYYKLLVVYFTVCQYPDHPDSIASIDRIPDE
jgi:hypothetical protein